MPTKQLRTLVGQLANNIQQRKNPYCAGWLAGDTARAASTGEVTALRREARELKEVVAEQTLELRLLKKSMIADGGDIE